jgi:hypothetical protein
MQKKKGKDYSLFIILIAIIVLSLILNTYGLYWGLPDDQHIHHSFHPDETSSLDSSLGILLSHKALYPSPTALGNGSMQFYIVAIVYQVIHGSNLGYIVKHMTPARINNLYILGRIVTIIMSIGAAIVLFLITYKIFGKFYAFIATLIFVSIPALVVSAHYFRSEVPATFWILLSFLMSISIFKSGKLKFYILAGIFAGFATSTKYNSVLIFLPLICAHVMVRYKATKSTALKEYFNKDILLALVSGIATFFIGSPGTIIYWNEFIQRLSKQWTYQTGSALIETMERGPGWIGYLTRILPYSMGWPLLIMSLLGIVYALWRRGKHDILLFSWIVPYYLLLGFGNWWVVRYTVPLMPFMAIFSGRILIDLFLKMKGILKSVILIVGIIIIAFTLMYSFELDRIMAEKDPRIEAYDWINKNIAPGTAVGVDFTPAAFYPCINTQRYKIIVMRMDKSKINLIDYYIANDQIYLQYLRLYKKYPSQASYFRDIFYNGQFKKIVEFENTFNLLGMKFNKVDMPHDYFYFMTKISIYENTERLLNTSGESME